MLNLKFNFWKLSSTLCYLALVASKVWKQNLNFPCTVQCGGIWAANKKIALSMHFCDEFFNFMIFERGSKPLCSSTLKSFTVAFSKFPKRSICVLLYLISRDVLWGKQIKLYHAVKALGSFNKVEMISLYYLHLQWKFKLWVGKFTWGNKARHCWVMTTNFLFSKVFWQCPAMFCLYTSRKLFRP